MSKIKNKKRLSTMVVAFAIIFAAGVVYAATTGALTFQGTVTLDPDVSLVLSSTDPNVDISTDGQIATFTIQLPDASDDLDIDMTVTNEGNTAAIIADALRDQGGSAGLIITGYDVLFDKDLDVGAHEDFTLNFSLDPTDQDVQDGMTVFSFTFMLDYQIN